MYVCISAAFCCNPADDKWYVYDDSQVKQTSEDQIVTRAAYLLFYQRRSIHSVAYHHSDWIFNVAQIEYRPRPSKSQEDLLEGKRRRFRRQRRPYSYDLSDLKPHQETRQARPRKRTHLPLKQL